MVDGRGVRPLARIRRALAPLVVAACLAAPAGAAAQGVSLAQVGGPFASPTYVTAPPGDGQRLMVVEQGGTVRVIRDGVTLATPFLTIGGDFLAGGEQGLMSIAFRPDYESSRLLYAYFTDSDGDIRVDELRRAADTRDRVEPGYRRQVIEIPHPQDSHHNGGQLQFGSDGFLYLATGDGGGSYDPDGNGQRLQPRAPGDPPGQQPLLAKVLRIDPRPGGGYTIPAGNPFTGAGDTRVDEIWAYGLRNPFRFSFDRETGALWIGDVGQDRVEEIDHAPSVAGVGAGRGLNFGWGTCEGTREASNPNTVPDPAPACPMAQTGPFVEHLQSTGYCSIIGGYVVRDASVADLYGRYVYGDLCRSKLRSVGGAPGGDREENDLAVSSPLVSFGEDACGRVYTVAHGNPGAVSRIQDATAPAPCALRVTDSTPSNPSPADTRRAPRLKLGGPLRQRALKRGSVLVRVRCDLRCSVRALGRLSIRGRRRTRLRDAKLRSLAPHKTATLRLRLKRSDRRALRSTLLKGRSARVLLTVHVRANGRLTVRRRTVRIVG